MKEVQPKITEQDIDVYNDVHPWTDKDFDQATERTGQQLPVYCLTTCLLPNNLPTTCLTTTEKPSTSIYTNTVTDWVTEHGYTDVT